MSRIQSHFHEIDIIAKLADLKLDQYHHTLLISAITELLVEQDLITREALAKKAAELDHIKISTDHPTV